MGESRTVESILPKTQSMMKQDTENRKCGVPLPLICKKNPAFLAETK